MALAKYHEEIGERWIANTAARYEAQVTDWFARFPTNLPSAGEVYLTRAGRRMEDVEVCEAGQTLDLSVVSTSGTLAPEIELEDNLGRRPLELRADGRIAVPFPKAATLRLHASSGGYLKSYTFHAVEPFSVEELPDFAKLIQSLADNPPQWTESSFSEFRTKLEAVLSTKDVPSVFTEGIIEYHLGLFHEEQGIPAYHERFQAAYGCLRWFIPYSDVARLICIYFLYCANEFEAAESLCQRGMGRLRSAVSFFRDREGAQAGPKAVTKNGASGPSLLVALPDLLTFQAIEALGGGRAGDALELASVARRHTRGNFDKERTARISFLEARSRAALGDKEISRSIFESLQHSPWPAIAEAAKKHFNPSLHG